MMKFDHLQFRKNASVHLRRDDEETFCGQAYLGTQTFEGRRIALAYEVKSPATCGKCRLAMLVQLRQVLAKMTLPELESLAEEIS